MDATSTIARATGLLGCGFGLFAGTSPSYPFAARPERLHLRTEFSGLPGGKGPPRLLLPKLRELGSISAVHGVVNVEIVLRSYRAEDLDTMYKLDRECFEPQFRFSRSAMRRFAEARNARVVIADDGGKLAGFGILHIEGAEHSRAGYIVTLDVSPGYRRTGLGRRLMRAMEEQARAAACDALVLHVFTGNAAAMRFYEANGFSRLQSAPDFYGAHLDAWVYRRCVERAGKL